MAGMNPARFSYVPTIDGFDVVCDLTGHTVVPGRPSAASANGIAQTLNAHARAGTLSHALGAHEPRRVRTTSRAVERRA